MILYYLFVKSIVTYNLPFLKNENNNNISNNNNNNFTNKYKNISNSFQKNINEFNYIDPVSYKENVNKFDQKTTNKNICFNKSDFNQQNLSKKNDKMIDKIQDTKILVNNDDNFSLFNVNEVNSVNEVNENNSVNVINKVNVGSDDSIFQNLEENYINASCLDGGPLEGDKGMFIATQGPIKKKIFKFWKLVLQKGVVTVIMLCREIEDLRVRFEFLI